MMHKFLCNTARRYAFSSIHLVNSKLCNIQCTGRCFYTVCNNITVLQTKINDQNLFICNRFKHNRRKQSAKELETADADDDDDSSINSNEDEASTEGSKIILSKVNSLRLDAVAKTGLGVSRSTIDEAFYNSRIRVNGEKVFKKAIEVNVGDEIDLIRGRSIDNPDFLTVNRIKILSIQVTNNGFKLKLSRDKSLLIENYDVPWKDENQ